jgi:hypothetical protein
MSYNSLTTALLIRNIGDFDLFNKVCHSHNRFGTKRALLISKLETSLDVSIEISQHAQDRTTLILSRTFRIRHQRVFDGGVGERLDQFRDFRSGFALFSGLNKLFRL